MRRFLCYINFIYGGCLSNFIIWSVFITEISSLIFLSEYITVLFDRITYTYFLRSSVIPHAWNITRITLKQQLIPFANETFSRVLHGRDEIHQPETGTPPWYSVSLACFRQEKERNRIKSANWIGNTREFSREYFRDWGGELCLNLSWYIKIRDKNA